MPPHVDRNAEDPTGRTVMDLRYTEEYEVDDDEDYEAPLGMVE